MIKRVLGLIVSLAGLGIIAYSANQIWDYLAREFYGYSGPEARIATMLNLHLSEPLVLISVAFVGGLVFVAGCVVATPGQESEIDSVK